jgi:hypothetical protein
MRMLTEEELSAVFGAGDGQVKNNAATTLATVTVNASVAGNPDYTFSEGSSYSPTGYGEYGSGCYWNGVGGALAHIPSDANIRCLVHATADPGWDFYTAYSIHFVNNYAFAPATGDISNLALQRSSTPPADKPGIVAGVSQQADNGSYYSTTFFAAANTAYPGGGETYRDISTGYTHTIPALNATEMLIFTGAHEAAHTQGVPGTSSGEQLASGYGMDAVNRYRANNSLIYNCPN